MAITSSDILNLSHALKDVCEVNCNTPECLSQTLKIMLQYNLIQANLQYMLANESSCRLQCNPMSESLCRSKSITGAPVSKTVPKAKMECTHGGKAERADRNRRDTLQEMAGHAHEPASETENFHLSGDHGLDALREIAVEHMHDHDRASAENHSIPAGSQCPDCN